MAIAGQHGYHLKPGHLKGLLVSDLVPAYLRQTYLLGVNLGPGWQGAHGDAAMQVILNGIITDVQHKLGIRFLQQRLVTDPDEGQVLGVDYDVKGERLMYLRTQMLERHYSMPLPHAHVVSIQRVRFFAGEHCLGEVPQEWISCTAKEGILRMTPTTTWQAVPVDRGRVGAPWYRTLDHPELPAAWSCDYTFGTGTVDDDIALYIGLSAAIMVLSLVGAGTVQTDADGTITGGAAGAGGVASQSLAMDGVVESTSYVQGPYGPHSGVIQAYQAQLGRLDLTQMRLSKRGIKVAAW